MEDKNRKARPVANVIAVGVVVVVAACIVLLYFGVGPFLTVKAHWYAREVADPTGNRGQAAKDLMELGPRAYPVVRDLLIKSDEYTTRKYGLTIIRQLRLAGAADDVFNLLKRETYDRNRSYALITLEDLVPKRWEYLKRVVPYLDDPSREVRDVASGAMEVLYGEYLPDRTPDWWKQWWAENKDRIEQKCKEKAGKAEGTQKTEEPPKAGGAQKAEDAQAGGSSQNADSAQKAEGTQPADGANTATGAEPASNATPAPATPAQ